MAEREENTEVTDSSFQLTLTLTKGISGAGVEVARKEGEGIVVEGGGEYILSFVSKLTSMVFEMRASILPGSARDNKRPPGGCAEAEAEAEEDERAA